MNLIPLNFGFKIGGIIDDEKVIVFEVMALTGFEQNFDRLYAACIHESGEIRIHRLKKIKLKEDSIKAIMSRYSP